MESAPSSSFSNPASEEALIDLLRAENETLRAALKRTSLERDYFKEQLAARIRQLFAAKSEARASQQADLFFNEAEVSAVASVTSVAAAESVTVPTHQRKRGGRRPLDAGLPRIVVRHELPESEQFCVHDGSRLREFGVETAEQLDIVPAQIRVIRHERVKYACPCCAQGVRVAPAPVRLLPKSQLSEAALAWIITAKYQDALPLHRQAAILRRFGGDIARHTLANSVIRAGAAVQPLINLLRDRLLEAPVIHGDETELQVLKEDGRAATTKSYLWLQMTATGPPVRLFTYAPSRSAKTALELYAGATGVGHGWVCGVCGRCPGWAVSPSRLLGACAATVGGGGRLSPEDGARGDPSGDRHPGFDWRAVCGGSAGQRLRGCGTPGAAANREHRDSDSD